MSGVSLSPGPFPGFTKLAPSVWFIDPTSKPTANGAAIDPKQPDLIVLSTWMGAAPKHILKYVQGYSNLFPGSPILILTNEIAGILFRSHAAQRSHSKPAIRAIHEVASAKQKPKILLHIFSNGGAHYAAHLASLYRKQFNTPLPITSMILDSTPGRATYGRTVKAMAVGLPRSFILRVVGMFLIHLLCIGMWINHHVLRRENIIARVRKQLLDPELFPISAPRCYVYSKADEMVGWQDVEINAKQAETIGYRVQRRRYEKSKHVGHLMTDPQAYWNTVVSMVD